MKNKDLSRFYPNAGKLGNDEFLRKSEGGGSGLPDVTAEDNGKTVYVADGEWEVGYSEIPNVVIASDAMQLDFSNGTDFLKKGIPFIITNKLNTYKFLIRPISEEGNRVGFERYSYSDVDDQYVLYGILYRVSEGVYSRPSYDNTSVFNYLRSHCSKVYPTFISVTSSDTSDGFLYGNYSGVNILTPDRINGVGIYTVDLSDAKSQFDVIFSSLKTAASASANTHITKYTPLTGELAAYTGLIVRNAANAYNVNGKTIMIKYGDLIVSLGSVALDENYVGYLSYKTVEPDTVSKKLYEITVLLSSTGFESAEAYFDVVCRSATVISQ